MLTFGYYFRIDVLNNFIRKRVTAKSNDFKSLMTLTKSHRRCLFQCIHSWNVHGFNTMHVNATGLLHRLKHMFLMIVLQSTRYCRFRP